MMKYRKKPVVIEALRLPALNEEATPEFVDELHDFLGDQPWESDRAGALVIRTLEGDMRADPGDWIIRGVAGELYPCKPNIFAATYEPAEEAARVEVSSDLQAIRASAGRADTALRNLEQMTTPAEEVES